MSHLDRPGLRLGLDVLDQPRALRSRRWVVIPQLLLRPRDHHVGVGRVTGLLTVGRVEIGHPSEGVARSLIDAPLPALCDPMLLTDEFALLIADPSSFPALEP